MAAFRSRLVATCSRSLHAVAIAASSNPTRHPTSNLYKQATKVSAAGSRDITTVDGLHKLVSVVVVAVVAVDSPDSSATVVVNSVVSATVEVFVPRIHGLIVTFVKQVRLLLERRQAG